MEVMESTSERNVGKRLALTVVVAMLLTTLASPASAAGGSFDWTFTGKCCIYSREWTTTLKRDIWIDVDSVAPCDVLMGSKPVVRITLQQKGAFGWASKGSKDIANCSGDVKWANMEADQYRFYMTLLFPHRDSKNYTIKGSVAYDGRVT